MQGIQSRASSALARSAGSVVVSPTTPRAAQRRQQRFRSSVIATASSNDEARSSKVPDFMPVVSLGGDAYILRSFVRPADQAAPRFDLDFDAALNLQLEALQRNNQPYPDHGVEVMYRFAAFDPFERSRYFGKSFDLGQFERFRRVFHTPAYRALLCHDTVEVVGRLQMGEGRAAVRVLARHDYPAEEQTYTITMVQRQGGPYDGYWVTESLLCDSLEWEKSIISW